MANLPGVGVVASLDVLASLIPALNESGFNICGIWGKTKEDAENAANTYNIAFCSCRVDDVLLSKNVELVFVNLPPNSLYPVVKKVLGIGKHVVSSSPIGLSLHQMEELVEAAEYYPSLVSVVSWPLRFNAAVLKMKELIAEGYVGELHSLELQLRSGPLTAEVYDWRCDARTGGGALNLLGAQAVDLLHAISGLKVKKLSALLRTFRSVTQHVSGIRNVTADDFCALQLRLEGQVCATINAVSAPIGDGELQLHVTGAKGALRLQGNELHGTQLGCDEQLLCSPKDTPFLVSPLVRNLHQAFDRDRGESHLPVAAGLHQAMYATRVLAAARRSAQEDGVWNRVQYPAVDK